MERNKKRNVVTDIDPNGWMTTFSDLIMLLLTFFVMLLSMSSMDDLTIKKMFSVLMGAIGSLELVNETNIRPFKDVVPTTVLNESSLLNDGNQLKSLLSESKDSECGAAMDKYGENINIYNDAEGVVIAFKASILFAPGKADINPEMLPIIERLGKIIEATTNDILIIGHTDNVPIRSGRYRSNWELSFFRSLSFLNYFLEETKIPPERFGVGGAGDSQPRFPNTTSENRKKNRRVEIIFKKIK
jgi:chemotaxis protein MotB